MHVCGINIPDLLQKLFRGTIECDVKNGDSKLSWDWVVLTGDTWKCHGKLVTNARHTSLAPSDVLHATPLRKYQVDISAGSFYIGYMACFWHSSMVYYQTHIG